MSVKENNKPIKPIKSTDPLVGAIVRMSTIDKDFAKRLAETLSSEPLDKNIDGLPYNTVR